MRSTNIEVESHLDSLAELCCQSLQGEQPLSNQRSEELLKSLLMSGYARQQESSLQVDLERRINDRCADKAMHRGGALSSLTAELQAKFDQLNRWDAKHADGGGKSSSANPRPATES